MGDLSPKMRSVVIAVLVGCVIAVFAVMVNIQNESVGADPPEKYKCLWQAVDAYPTWDKKSGNVLDSIESCKSVSQDDKTRIRKMMVDFVTTAISQKG